MIQATQIVRLDYVRRHRQNEVLDGGMTDDDDDAETATRSG
jgi:hypothetical protein